MTVQLCLTLLIGVAIASLLTLGGAGYLQIHKVFTAADFADSCTVPGLHDLGDQQVRVPRETLNLFSVFLRTMN